MRFRGSNAEIFQGVEGAALEAPKEANLKPDMQTGKQFAQSKPGRQADCRMNFKDKVDNTRLIGRPGERRFKSQVNTFQKIPPATLRNCKRTIYIYTHIYI